MIFVILGTQDKQFLRLLKSIEENIKNGNIKKEVIVQAGSTKYKSKNMKIYDFMSMEKFSENIEKSDYIITHGGVGTILDSLKKNKKVIAVPRLEEYQEHENNHQLEIIEEFGKGKYILPCYDLNELDKVINELDKFKPKEYKGNNDKMIKLIDNYIENSKPNNRREVLTYLIFGALTTIINIITYFLLTDVMNINYLFSNVIAWFLSVTFAYITNKLFVFEKSSRKVLEEAISFYGFRVASLGIDSIIMYSMVSIFKINDLLSKIVANVVVIIVNYIFSKLFTFKGGK